MKSFLSLFFLLFLTQAFHHHTRKALKTDENYIVIGDAGSTGTRFYFYLKTGNRVENAVSFEYKVDERLGLALASPEDTTKVANYATKVLVAFQNFINKPGRAQPLSSETTYELYIYSTAGSRGTLVEDNSRLSTFTAKFKTALKAALVGKDIKINVDGLEVNVISGRMEGILGYVSLLIDANRKDDAPKSIYYEIGGASSQIVWQEPDVPANSKDFKFRSSKNSNSGVVKIDGAKYSLPSRLFSKSFLGNGAEKCVIAAWTALEACENRTPGDPRYTCLVDAAKANLVTGGFDQTKEGKASEKHSGYRHQWHEILDRFNRVFPTATSIGRPNIFYFNAKSLYLFICQRTDGGSPGDCDKRTDTMTSENLGKLKEKIIAAMNKIFSELKGLSAPGKEKLLGFAKQGICVGAQVAAILENFPWTNTIKISWTGKWSDAAAYFLSKGALPKVTFFEAFKTPFTNSVEDVGRRLDLKY